VIRGLSIVLVFSLVLSCLSGLGERCAANQPCPEALQCSYPPGDGGVGICDYPPKQFGDPCSSALECAADLTCSIHFTPGQRYGTCVHRRGDGEPCFEDRDCQSNFCAGATGTGIDGTCRMR